MQQKDLIRSQTIPIICTFESQSHARRPIDIDIAIEFTANHLIRVRCYRNSVHLVVQYVSIDQ